MKTCTKCDQEKTLDSFNACEKYPDGLRYWCKDCSVDYARDYYTRTARKNKTATYKTREEKLARKRELWRIAMQDPAKRKQHARSAWEWQKKNPEVRRQKEARRRMVCLRARPSWSDEAKIRKIYAAARDKSRETGEVWHVDHIVPLKHPLVCGLHTHQNLQVLSRSENSTKGNRHWPGMP